MRRRRVGALGALFAVLCGALVGIGLTGAGVASAATGTMSRAIITVPSGSPKLKAGYYRFEAINVQKSGGSLVITLAGDTNGNGQDYTLAVAPPTGSPFVSATPYNDAGKLATVTSPRVDFIANGGTPCTATFGSLHIKSYTESGGFPTSVALEFLQKCDDPNAGETTGWVTWQQPFAPLNNPPMGEYVGLTNPARLVDTRLNGGALTAGATRNFNTTSVGVPSNAIAVVANLTAVTPTQSGFLSLYPAGGSVPLVSNLNFSAGSVIPNLSVVQTGNGDSITLFNSFGNTHVIIDIMGYYAPGAVGGRFQAITPAFRALDTRLPGVVPVTAGVPYLLGIDAAASAVVVNVTVTGATNNGSYLTVYPAGEFAPVASNLNFNAGETIPNLVIARTGTGVNAGKIALLLSVGRANVIVDVVGVFNGDRSTGKGQFVPVSPRRALDSRAPNSASITALAPDTWSPYIGIVGLMGNLPFEYGTVVVNTTITGTTAGGFLTVYPAPEPIPGLSGYGGAPSTSNLNWGGGGETRANMVMAPVNRDGFLQLYNSNGFTHFILDVAGWYTP